MKRNISLILLVLLLIQFLLSEEKKRPELQVSLGTKVNNVEIIQVKLESSNPLSKVSLPFFSALISGSSGKLFYALESIINGDMRDQRHELNLDFGRIFQEKLQFPTGLTMIFLRISTLPPLQDHVFFTLILIQQRNIGSIEGNL